MGPSKKRREDGADVRRQHRAELARAAEEAARRAEEAKQKADEEKGGEKK